MGGDAWFVVVGLQKLEARPQILEREGKRCDGQNVPKRVGKAPNLNRPAIKRSKHQVGVGFARLGFLGGPPVPLVRVFFLT